MFYGENLELIRECRNFSRNELATNLGVSEQVIWQYELNQTEPSFEMINKLKELFHVHSQYFYHSLKMNDKEPIGRIAYREKNKGSRKIAKMEMSYLSFIDTYIDKIEQKIYPDKGIIFQLKKIIEEKYTLFNLSKNVIDEIAEYVRKELSIQNNKELLFKLELNGIYIFERYLEEEVDAYSGWIGKNIRPYIVLNKGKNPFVRRNFDLAHELGHLLLHGWVDMDDLDKEEMKRIEEEANFFASCFLLPKKDILSDISSLDKISNPKAYIPLKEKYYVSIQAIAMRVYKLGGMTYQQYQYFWRMINKYNFKTKEPLDNEFSLIIPGKIRALLEEAFDNGVYVLNDLLAEWYIDQEFLEYLFCLEKGYFNPFLQLSTNYKLKQENLIRFPMR